MITTHDPDTRSKGAKIADGIAIIIAKEPDAEACAVHDQLFFGACDDRYSPEEKARLNALGWFEDENGWAILT